MTNALANQCGAFAVYAKWTKTRDSVATNAPGNIVAHFQNQPLFNAVNCLNPQ
jgi:hypothetical protein